jgi:hypothetical protein
MLRVTSNVKRNYQDVIEIAAATAHVHYIVETESLESAYAKQGGVWKDFARYLSAGVGSGFTAKAWGTTLCAGL